MIHYGSRDYKDIFSSPLFILEQEQIWDRQFQLTKFCGEELIAYQHSGKLFDFSQYVFFFSNGLNKVNCWLYATFLDLPLLRTSTNGPIF